MKKTSFILLFLTFAGTSFGVPNMDIQFGGALKNSCNFVDNNDVIDALESTLQVLNQIQEVERECQNILINSKAFIESSLANAVALQDQRTTSENNKLVIENFIQSKISSGQGYSGEFDYELLTAQKEISLYDDKEFQKDLKVAQTMQLGITLFDDLLNAPNECTHSFGRDILAPSIAVTGRVFGTIDPGIGLLSNLLSSMINYGSRVMDSSYQSLKSLTNSKNFHMNYKCTMKNIEDMICGLEEEEEAIRSAQTQSNDNQFLYEYRDQILSYDTDDEDFRKLLHLNRHRYRISKILEDLDNIYRSPETANDLKTVVSHQTQFTKLSLMPRLNPLKNKAYVEAMLEAGYAKPGQLDWSWETWDNNQASIGSWLNNFIYGAFREVVETNCASIDTNKYPELRNIYNPNQNDCQTSRIREEAVMTSFIQAVIVPSLIFYQGEIIRLNDKIKENANIHAFYENVKSQQQNTGNIDYNEYNLVELFDLYKSHASSNLTSSLRLYSNDIIRIMDALIPLLEAEELEFARTNSFDSSFDAFVEATKEAYSKIATVSNNGVEGGILYRSIVESKISSYLDGVKNNFLFNKDKKLAQNFVNFNFHAEYLDELINKSEKLDYEGSSNLAVMEDVKTAFLNTFGKTIIDIMEHNIERYKRNPMMKRELIHSCAIFAPQLNPSKRKRVINGKFRTVLGSSSKVKRFCYDLIEEEGGLFMFSNSPEKFPLETEDGLKYSDSCYYRAYEEAGLIYKLNKGKRSKVRFRL